MDRQAFQAFTDELIAQAQHDDTVLGLVAAGSMADLSRQDAWSDHDFFWVVQNGHGQTYRAALGWLPRADRIALQFQETAHGFKVMYDDGHLLEFAVFDLDELAYAKVNDYAVLVDKLDITARMAQIERESIPTPAPALRDALHCLSLLQVGSGRYVRGERISGHVFIKTYALSHFLRLITTLYGQNGQKPLDSLDPFRRFEQAFPELGQALSELLLQDPLTCALGLIALLDEQAKPRMSDYPQAAIAVVQAYVLRLAHNS